MSNPIVFSTDPKVTQPDKTHQAEPVLLVAQTTLVIQRQTKGRGGKTVSIISGLLDYPNAAQQLLKEIKKHCGCGGALKEGNLEIQGDKRAILQTFLAQKGYKIKLAGG